MRERFRQFLHAIVPLAFLAWTATAGGQATSGHLPDPLGWRRLEELLDRNVEPPLTAAQEEVAAALARDAAGKYRAVRDAEVERFLAKADELLSLRRAPDRAAIREAFARQSAIVAGVEAIDGEVLAGVEATLDDPQRVTFARVRREREREVLVATMPLGRDPGLRRPLGPCLGAIGAGAEEFTRIRGLLDANEPAVNDRLRAVRDRTRELFLAAGSAFETEVGVLPPIGTAIDPDGVDRLRSAITARVAREIDGTVAAIRALRKVQDETLDAACAMLPREKAVLLRAVARTEPLALSIEARGQAEVLLGKAISLERGAGGPIPIADGDPIRPEEVAAVRSRLLGWLEADRPWLEEFLAVRDRQLPSRVADLAGGAISWLPDLGLSLDDLPEDRRAAAVDRETRAAAELAWVEKTLGERRFAGLPPATLALAAVGEKAARWFLPTASMAWMRPAERPADSKQARRAAWATSRSTWGRGGLVEPPDKASEGSLRAVVARVSDRAAVDGAFRSRTAALGAVEARITTLAASEREWSGRAFGPDTGSSDPDPLLDRNRAERDSIFLAIAEADETFFASLRSIVEADRVLPSADRRGTSVAIEAARIDRAVDREIAANLGLNTTFELEGRVASPVAAMRDAGIDLPNPSVAERLLRATDLALADLRRLRGIAFRDGGAADVLRMDFGDVEAVRRRMDRAHEYSVARKRLVATWQSLLAEWLDAFPPADRDRFVSAYLRRAAPDLFAAPDDPLPLLEAARLHPDVAIDPEALAVLADLEVERRTGWLAVCEAIARSECLLEPREARIIERLEWERAEASAQIVGRLRRAIGDEVAEAIGLPGFSARLRSALGPGG